MLFTQFTLADGTSRKVDINLDRVCRVIHYSDETVGIVQADGKVTQIDAGEWASFVEYQDKLQRVEADMRDRSMRLQLKHLAQAERAQSGLTIPTVR